MSTPESIRAALAAENFGEAARLFDQFAQGPCDIAAVDEARNLLASALAARAHLKGRLDGLRARVYVAGAYSTVTPRE